MTGSSSRRSTGRRSRRSGPARRRRALSRRPAVPARGWRRPFSAAVVRSLLSARAPPRSSSSRWTRPRVASWPTRISATGWRSSRRSRRRLGLLAVGVTSTGSATSAPGWASTTPSSSRRRPAWPSSSRPEPHDAFPRPRVVLDLALHPLRDLGDAPALARGRAEVPHRRGASARRSSCSEARSSTAPRARSASRRSPPERTRPIGSSSSPGSR